MDNVQVLVGKRIREYRLYRGLSIEELAKKASLNAAHLSAIERGEKNPTLLTLSKIVTVLDYSFQDLLDFVRTPDEIASDYASKILPMLGRLNVKEQEMVYSLIKTLADKTV